MADFGRNSAVARAAAAAGMTHTSQIPHLLMRWDGWQTTAQDQVRLLASISQGRGAADRYTRWLMARVIPRSDGASAPSRARPASRTAGCP